MNANCPEVYYFEVEKGRMEVEIFLTNESKISDVRYSLGKFVINIVNVGGIRITVEDEPIIECYIGFENLKITVEDLVMSWLDITLDSVYRIGKIVFTGDFEVGFGRHRFTSAGLHVVFHHRY